jgi:hypothetical protein
MNVLPDQVVELALPDGYPSFSRKLGVYGRGIKAPPQQSKYVFAYREYFDPAFAFAHCTQPHS